MKGQSHLCNQPDFLSRRVFLKIAGCSALATCAGPPIAAAPNGKRKRRIIIIGAGVAGLAASQTLQAAGFSTVVVEARERIGGRVWTDRHGFDLGAGWIHGRRGNPLMELVKSTKARTFPFDYDNHWRYSASGELSDAKDRQIDADYASLEKRIAQAQRKAVASAPLSGVVAPAIQELDSERAAGLRYAVHTSITHEYAAEPAQLSLRHFDGGADQAGGDLLLPDGYAALLQGLGSPDELLLGHIVQKISTSDDDVVVETNKGKIIGEAAVVTLPLGVLKSGKVTFSPELPATHREAINRLGFGTLDKLFLRFPKITWPKEPHLFGYVGDGWWEEWVNFAPVSGAPLLVGFNAGSQAIESEKLSERKLVGSAMGVLRDMFGSSLPDPVQAVATRWNSDPFCLGSYSSYAPGSAPRDRINLAQPITPRLILAGEACSLDHAATVHGALSSGRHAASILAGHLKA